MAVADYDPKRIVVSFKGRPLSGFADGTFVSISMAAEAFTKVSGADASVSRARTNDDTAEVSVTFLQTSDSNDFLSNVHNEDKRFGTGKGPLLIKDLFGTTLFFAPQAWVVQFPDMEYGKEITEREWTFNTGQVEHFVGGALVEGA